LLLEEWRSSGADPTVVEQRRAMPKVLREALGRFEERGVRTGLALVGLGRGRG